MPDRMPSSTEDKHNPPPQHHPVGSIAAGSRALPVGPFWLERMGAAVVLGRRRGRADAAVRQVLLGYLQKECVQFAPFVLTECGEELVLEAL